MLIIEHPLQVGETARGREGAQDDSLTGIALNCLATAESVRKLPSQGGKKETRNYTADQCTGRPDYAHFYLLNSSKLLFEYV